MCSNAKIISLSTWMPTPMEVVQVMDLGGCISSPFSFTYEIPHHLFPASSNLLTLESIIRDSRDILSPILPTLPQDSSIVIPISSIDFCIHDGVPMLVMEECLSARGFPCLFV